MYTGPRLHTDSLVFAFDPNSRVCNSTLATGADLSSFKCFTNEGPETLIHAGLAGTITTSSTDQGLVIGTASTGVTDHYKSTTAFDFSSSDITMTMWAKYTASPGGSAQSGLSFHSHSNNNGIALTMLEAGGLDFRVGCSTGNGTTRTFSTYYGQSNNIYNRWAYLALTYNNTTDEFKLYVDGVQDHSFTYAQSNAAREVYLFTWSTSYSTNSSYRSAYLQGLCTIHKHLFTADMLLDNFNATKHRYL